MIMSLSWYASFSGASFFASVTSFYDAYFDPKEPEDPNEEREPPSYITAEETKWYTNALSPLAKARIDAYLLDNTPLETDDTSVNVVVTVDYNEVRLQGIPFVEVTIKITISSGPNVPESALFPPEIQELDFFPPPLDTPS